MTRKDNKNYYDSLEEAFVLYQRKRYKEALKIYMESIEEGKDNKLVLFNAATCELKLENYDNSIKLFKKALEYSKDSNVYYNLAYCYYKLFNYKKALIYFKIAWSLNPEDDQCEKAIDKIMKNYIGKGYENT